MVYAARSTHSLELPVKPPYLDVAQACATIAGANSPAAITGMLVNARRLLAGQVASLTELEAAATERLAILTGEVPGGPLAAEWDAMIARYEAVRSAADGRPFRATRARNLRLKHGVIQAIERLVKGSDTDALRYLIEAGAQEDSVEAIVLRHPRLFGSATARQAKVKLPWMRPQAA